MKIKKEFYLSGLECANCASKIENKLSQLDEISEVSVNFMNKKLVYYVEEGADTEAIEAKVKKIIDEMEEGVVLEPIDTSTKITKKLYLEGLDCANCADKIETELKKIDGIENVSVSFATKTIMFESDTNDSVRKVSEIESVVNKIEPDIKVVSDFDKKSTEKAENDEEKTFKMKVRILIVALVMFFSAMLIPMDEKLELALLMGSYVLVGLPIVIKAIKNIFRGQVFDENFLMSLATVAAISIGEYSEAVAVMLFYQVGELFQTYAVNNSRKSISSLMDIRPDFANVMVDNELKKVSPEEVHVGDKIVVKVGEKIPLDGVVVDGNSSLDVAALTGESKYKDVTVNDEVLSGSINTSGVLTIEVQKEFGDSTVSKILDLVENASSKKANTENFITKFARYYTPAVVIIAVLMAIVPPFVLNAGDPQDWMNRALVFLVISCPCALVISIPLGYFSGIGASSKNGILVKGSNYLEALTNVDTAIFDKTGTLTKGTFTVNEIVSVGNYSESELLEFAAYGESFSNHPIAVSLRKSYGEDIDNSKLLNYEEISGHGIKVNYDDKQLLIGNSKLMNRENVEYSDVAKTGTIVHVAIDGRYEGYIIISDAIKEESFTAIRELKENGIKKTIMLTGDNKEIAKDVADQLKIDEFYGELLPTDKFEILEKIDSENKSESGVIFVGDGINDAPVLARADVGIAMGGVGSDAAIESADIVIMNDDPRKIVTVIKIARLTQKIVIQNIIFALAVKFIILFLGAMGLATMWEAVFADVGVSAIAILNSIRILKFKE